MAAAQGVTPVLFGPADAIGEVSEGVEVVDAPVSIAKAAEPASAVRGAPEASIVQAAMAVSNGDCDAWVTGGSTGSAVAAGLFHIKRARGIYRPALALPIPVPGAPILLLDVGANLSARPEHLVQFAFMGAAMSRAVLGVARPRVALLSNGEEATKGTEDVVAAHEQLAARAPSVADLEFVGNIEGTQVTTGAADVIVTDGFTGNIALKLLEGTAGTILGAVRDAATSTSRAKLGGMLLRPALRRFRDQIDPEGPGGAYMLGLRRAGIVAHGRFTRHGFSQAIAVAERGVREQVVERTHALLDSAGALRSVPVSEPAASVGDPR